MKEVTFEIFNEVSTITHEYDNEQNAWYSNDEIKRFALEEYIRRKNLKINVFKKDIFIKLK
jgi:hypothetical protein